MVGAPHADPRHAGVARQRNRGLGGARHHQVSHAVVAVDQRGCGRAARHRDVRMRIEAAGLQPPHILRQAEHAMRVGAGQVRLAHQLGANCRILARQAGGAERIRDQRADRRDRHFRLAHSRPRSAASFSTPIRAALSSRWHHDISTGDRRGRMRASRSRPHINAGPSAGNRHEQARVVIVGAGFGGLSAAKALAGSAFDVTVIDQHNYHLFQPLLYQVATAGPLAGRYRLADPRHSGARAERQRRARQGVRHRHRAARGRRRRPPHSVRPPDPRDRRAARLFRSRRLGGLRARA